MLKEFFWIITIVIIITVGLVSIVFHRYEAIEKECASQGKVAVKSPIPKGYVCIKSD